MLFDFFGTLVDYSPSRIDQGYGRSHTLLRQLGVGLGYQEFLATWSQVFAEFDRRSDQDDSEFSMTELGTAFLGGVLPCAPSGADVDAFVAQYLAEWCAGVRYVAGVPELVAQLAQGYRLAVVTNTHQPDLVAGHLAELGLLSMFDAVVSSVEVGWRKPHPAIYSAALEVLGVDASSSVFVGDTYRPDFEGPQRAGMMAYLIDPHQHAPVPESRRLSSIFDLPARLDGQDR